MSRVIMSYFRHMRFDHFKLDFLMTSSQKSGYENEITARGSRFFYLDLFQDEPESVKEQKLIAFLRAHPEYQCIVIHASGVKNLIYRLVAQAAYKLKIPVVIGHIHTTILPESLWQKLNWKGKIIHAWQLFLHKLTHRQRITHRYACGELAGQMQYPNQSFTVAKNAIEVSNFRFSMQDRQTFRARYNISDQTLLIGMAASLIKLKNHTFLLDVFAALLRKHPDSVLILAGAGDEEQNLKAYADTLKISNNVIFAGLVTDIQRFYCALDYFVFTSPKEGLPMVAIEAQSTGLPFLHVDTVTHEIDILQQRIFLALSAGSETWANAILKASRPTFEARSQAYKQIKEAGYDCVDAAQKLENEYIQLINNAHGAR